MSGVARANMLAELRGWTQFVGLQIEYNLIERTPERELLPMAGALGLTVTPWSPLASGWLTGKYVGKAKEERRLDKTPAFARRTERNEAIARTVVKVAKAAGKSPAQVALNWFARRPQHHSHHRRAQARSVAGQSGLPQMVVERQATVAVGRGQQNRTRFPS